MLSKLLRTTLLVALITGLAACVHPHHPNPAFPRVSLAANGSLVVNQEPIIVKRKVNETAVITFSVPASSGLRFTDNGVVFTELTKVPGKERGQLIKLERPRPVDPGPFGCQTQKDGLEVVCRISPQVPAGLYAYTLSTRDKDGKSIILDPTGWIEQPEGP